MPLSAAALPIGPDDLARLRRWSSATRAPAVVVQRAKILLLAAEGAANTEIAERLDVSRPTVIAWRKRYLREGLAHGLADRPRRGRPQTVRRDRRAEILATTLGAKMAKGRLVRVSNEGFYEVLLDVSGKQHTCLLPIQSTILLAAEAEEEIAAIEVER